MACVARVLKTSSVCQRKVANISDVHDFCFAFFHCCTAKDQRHDLPKPSVTLPNDWSVRLTYPKAKFWYPGLRRFCRRSSGSIDFPSMFDNFFILENSMSEID